MKKISIIVVLFMFSVMSLNVGSFTANAFSDETASQMGIIYSDENVVVEVIEKTEIYEKTKITVRESGEVEYLEIFANFNAEPTYKATSSEGEVNTIQKVDDVVYMDGEVVAEVPKIEELDISEGSLKAENSKATWIKLGSYKASRSVNDHHYGAILALVGAVFGAVGAVGAYLASTFISLALKNVYYVAQQYRHSSVLTLAKEDYSIYRYSNYTGFIGSSSRQIVYTPY